jgi:hypothetical protein
MTVVLKVRFPVDDAALSLLHQRAFSPDRPDTETAIRPWAERLDRHSLTWIGAFKASTRATAGSDRRPPGSAPPGYLTAAKPVSYAN